MTRSKNRKGNFLKKKHERASRRPIESSAPTPKLHGRHAGLACWSAPPPGCAASALLSWAGATSFIGGRGLARVQCPLATGFSVVIPCVVGKPQSRRLTTVLESEPLSASLPVSRMACRRFGVAWLSACQPLEPGVGSRSPREQAFARVPPIANSVIRSDVTRTGAHGQPASQPSAVSIRTLCKAPSPTPELLKLPRAFR